jgi:hypothetical protein
MCWSCSYRAYDILAKVEFDKQYIVPKDCLGANFIFDIGDSERVSFNGIVVLKFYDKYRKVELLDAHRPAIKMTDWIEGSRVQYKKCVDIPFGVPEGEYKIYLSIAQAENLNKKIRIKNKLAANNEYYVGKVNIINSIDHYGVYDYEEERICAVGGYKWLSKEAALYMKYPLRKGFLYLSISSPVVAYLGKAQRSKIYLNNKLVDDIVFDSPGILERKYKIEDSAISENGICELKIISEESFVPVKIGLGADKRELSVKVHSIHFEEE